LEKTAYNGLIQRKGYPITSLGDMVFIQRLFNPLKPILKTGQGCRFLILPNTPDFPLIFSPVSRRI